MSNYLIMALKQSLRMLFDPLLHLALHTKALGRPQPNSTDVAIPQLDAGQVHKQVNREQAI